MKSNKDNKRAWAIVGKMFSPPKAPKPKGKGK